MADVLSQSEVESLLSALDPGVQVRQKRADDPNSQVSIYDFKRPERVSKEQMRGFQALHEGFGREFGAALSGMLRTIVEVKLISVDQLTYSEFVYSLENPSCFNLLTAEPLEGHIILDLNPSIVFPIIDRLLGGGRDSTQKLPGRPLTEIEVRLASRITNLAIEALKNAWARICQLDPKISQVESNPQLVQIVPPNEVIVLISFEITMGEMRGIMNLCIPFNTIEPLAGKFSSNAWSTYTQKQADARQSMNLESGVNHAKVNLVVRLAETHLTNSDLLNMAVGDVIPTGTEKSEPLQVDIEGVPKFYAQPGSYKGYTAVQIGEAIRAPEDIVEEKLKSVAATKPPQAQAAT
ncbi:Flagellar motor switch protein FliM [Symmachiella macrocystis]|uniref:Flagellar motor switch protein FliM n=1 Tax=Symmachiella macrocystis TaxID=2527985 RepID=A0A5C6BR74_9PLAN|nr:flagellar motor switch protein FliM [Symmachiella macrocystis]TWU14548.1 Flagellar motor switch protein FliM [Symmachiella macrocystis]